jgi:hypothetical protein
MAITARSQTSPLSRDSSPPLAVDPEVPSRMDSLEIALRRYRQIVPQAISRAENVPISALKVWLKEQFRRCLEDYTGMPSFRDEASWPIRALKPDGDTPERELIDKTAVAITRSAKVLRTLARKKLVDGRLKVLYPVAPRTGDQAITLTAKSAVGPQTVAVPQDDAAFASSKVTALADGNVQLVNVSDYFWPTQVYDQLADGARLQRAAFIVSLNPDLVVPGNFIVRCLLKRTRMHIEALRSFRHMVLSAIKDATKYAHDRSELTTGWVDLMSLKAQVESVFGGGEQTRLRDACVSLTQLYAALHPSPDLGWLGIGDTKNISGIPLLQREIDGLESPRFFERVAEALTDLRRLPAASDPAQSAIEQAIAAGGLVLIGARHQAFWETRPIPQLPASEWSLLQALAENARLGRSAEIRDVFGDKVVTESAMSSIWSRLSKHLPKSLRSLVEPGAIRATYRLKVDAHRIHILE